MAAVDAGEGALIGRPPALLEARRRDCPRRFHAPGGSTPAETARKCDEDEDEEKLTFLNKNVKSAHAISPEAIIFFKVFSRRRALTCR
jgi:hypothetical protein